MGVLKANESYICDVVHMFDSYLYKCYEVIGDVLPFVQKLLVNFLFLVNRLFRANFSTNYGKE